MTHFETPVIIVTIFKPQEKIDVKRTYSESQEGTLGA